MNANRFRLVFSKSLGMLVPVAEQTPSHRKAASGAAAPAARAPGVFFLNALAFGVAAALSASTFALPSGPTVVGGSASFAQSGNTLTVTNSNGAMINWQSFNIGANEVTRFVQPSASSSVLNRVVGNDPSAIYGQLSSNGTVWLINPAGILVGPGAVIDTAGFVASTLQVRAEDFLAGRLNFQATAGAGNIVNQGAIRTPAGGSVVLVGSNVTNEGIIRTPDGETLLAAGNTVSLIDTATPGVKIEITGDANNATNLGEIIASAGRIGIAGSLVKNSGTLDASSVVQEGGRIFLKASRDAYVDGAGRIVATGTQGGQVEVLGNRVAVMDQAVIDTSGVNGGGTILVGGDYQGKNPEVQTAEVTYFGPAATLKANATNGNGGKVIVWADDTARALGTIEAKGDSKGGFVETSGKRFLDANGVRVNTQGGTWLLDPTDIIIGPSTQLYQLSISDGVFSTQSGYGSTYIGWDTIIQQLAANNVVVTTASDFTNPTYGGSITIDSGPAYYGGDITITRTTPWQPNWSNTYYGAGYNSANSLTLLAHNAVNINAWFGNAGSGAINVLAGWNGNVETPNIDTSNATGKSINIGSGAGIASLGNVNLKAVDSVNIQSGAYGAGIDLGGTASLSIEANKLSVVGGTANNAQAFIRTNGTQSYVLGALSSSGGLFLQGSNSSGVYGAGAQIQSFGGAQNFEIRHGATMELRAGSGNGLVPANQWSGSCSIGNVCSGNSTSISQYSNGGQTIHFTVGGVLNLYGGNAGHNNYAEIENDGTGAQTITGNPSIVLRGGAGGGTTAVYGGEVKRYGNGAEIYSDVGTQTINAATLLLDGGNATYGGVGIGAPVQNITVTGALTLIGGGAGTLPTSFDAYGDALYYNEAVIGHDGANTINLSVGSLTMTGGPANMYGGSPAGIGAYKAASTVIIDSLGPIQMSSSSSAWSNLIGSLYADGGSVFMKSQTGNIVLNTARVGTGNSGLVGIWSQQGSIGQSAAGAITSGQLFAAAATGIDLFGTNAVGTFGANNTTSGSISFKNMGALSLAGVPAALAGVSTSGAALGNQATGGGINILANGSITWSGINSSAARTFGGNINLTASGASSDIIFNPNSNRLAVSSGYYDSYGGSISLNAGRDVLIGVGANGSYADIYSYNAPIQITAGRDLLVDNFSYVTTYNGDLTLTAARNLAVRSSVNPLASWVGTTGTGTLSLTATNGYIYIPNAGGVVPSGAPGTPGVTAATDVGGGRISSVETTMLSAKTGITATSPSNNMATLVASNSLSGDVLIANTRNYGYGGYDEGESSYTTETAAYGGTVFNIGNVSNAGTGALTIDNWGAVVINGNVSGGGVVTVRAHSPLTVNSGASVSGAGGVTLTAMPSVSGNDLLTISGNVGSSSGSILLSGGSGVTVGSGVRVSAPNGSIQLNSAYGPVSTSGAILSAPSVLVQGQATLPSTSDSSQTLTIEQLVSSVTSTTNQTPTESPVQVAALSPAPIPGTSTTSPVAQGQTIGGESGTFGSQSTSTSTSASDATGGAMPAGGQEGGEATSGEKKEEDKKEARKDEAADKKEDKPANRKVATCS